MADRSPVGTEDETDDARTGLSVIGVQRDGRIITDLPADRQAEVSRQAHVLTLPGEMGENFKCLALACGGAAISQRVITGSGLETSHSRGVIVQDD